MGNGLGEKKNNKTKTWLPITATTCNRYNCYVQNISKRILSLLLIQLLDVYTVWVWVMLPKYRWYMLPTSSGSKCAGFSTQNAFRPAPRPTRTVLVSSPVWAPYHIMKYNGHLRVFSSLHSDLTGENKEMC